MQTGIAEIVGLFLIVAGGAGIVAAAAMVSVALAVVVASSLIVLAGIVLVYVATALEQREKAKAGARP
jgi:hypothetical protein